MLRKLFALTFILCSLGLTPAAWAATSNSGLQLGYSELARGQYAAAISRFSAELTKQPDNTEARRYLVFALLHTGRAREAVAHCKELVRAVPDSAADFALLGDCLRANGDHRSALGSYSHAVELDARCFKAYVGMARSYMDSRNLKTARTVCTIALGKRPPAAETSELQQILQLASAPQSAPATPSSPIQTSTIANRASDAHLYR